MYLHRNDTTYILGSFQGPIGDASHGSREKALESVHFRRSSLTTRNILTTSIAHLKRSPALKSTSMDTSDDAPPSASSCDFLRLPGEIRNAIYAYTLTIQKGLMYYYGKDEVGRLYDIGFSLLEDEARTSQNKYHSEENFLEANQLKYTNRQLYAETRGLVLRYNHIIFEDIVELAAFLRSCPPTHLERLRDIEVVNPVFHWEKIEYTAQAQDRGEVFDFCRHHPQVLIRSIMRTPLSAAHFLLMAVHVELSARKSVAVLERTIPSESLRVSVVRHFLTTHHFESIEDIPEDVPFNFRIFPRRKGTEEESLQVFRNACQEDLIVMDRIVPTLKGGLEDWIDIVRDIIRNGI